MLNKAFTRIAEKADSERAGTAQKPPAMTSAQRTARDSAARHVCKLYTRIKEYRSLVQ